MASSNGGPNGGGHSGMPTIQQRAIQQQNIQQRAMQQQIYNTLQQQPPHPQGLQTAVPVGERVQNVVQLVSSLRLVKENMNAQEAMPIAMKFEHKAFLDAADKPSYDAECRQKLIQIKDARARQTAKLQQLQSQNAQGTQSGLAHQAPMQAMMPKQTQNQLQQGFPNPQLQHPMQASPLPPQIPQQQMAMGMNVANHQASGGMPQQQQANMQRHGPPQAARDDLNSFTPQENQQINLMVHRMLQSTPRAELEKIPALQNIAQELLQELARQKIDPLHYCLRREAARQVRLNKVRMQAQLANPQQSAGAGGRMAALPPGAGIMPQQVRPRSRNAMNGQAQQLGGMNPNQAFDPSLMGNINQIIGQQQAEALRSQDAGQIVVPASNNQGMAQQPVGSLMGMKQAQTSQNAGNTGTTRAMAPNSISQSQQQFMPQAAHMQAQSQAHARAAAQAKANQIASQGQSEVNAHVGPMALSQSPAVPNINRALGPAGQQGKPHATPQQQKRFPQMGQPVTHQTRQDVPQPRNAMTPHLQTNNQAQRPPIPANVPPLLQQQIANLPDDQKRAILARWHNQSRNVQAQSGNGGTPMPQRPVAMQPQMTQAQMQLLGQSMPPGQATNNQVMNTPNQVFTQRPPLTQQNIAQAMMTQQEMQQRSQQQQQQQQQQREAIRRQEIQRHHALQSLPPEKVQEMDDMEVPPGYLTAHNNTISQVPPNVRTWGHLKAWAHRNSHLMPAESLERLKALQFIHYSDVLNANQRRLAQQGGQTFPNPMSSGSMSQNYGLSLAPAAPMLPQGSQNGQVPLQRPMPQSYQMPSGMPPLQPPSAQEVQAARLRLPDHLKEATDEQVKTMIMKMMFRKAMSQIPNSMKGSNPMQLPGAQPSAPRVQHQEPQQQAPQQGPGELQQNRRQPNQINPNMRIAQEQQMQRSRQTGPTQESKATVGQVSVKPAKAAAPRRVGVTPQPQGSQDQKNLKRPSYDEVVEVPDPNLFHTQPAQQVKSEQSQTEKDRPVLGPTAEQLASMLPKQRVQLEAIREQAEMMRQANLSYGGQQGLAPTAENRLENERQMHEFERKDARLKQIIQEVVQSSPKRQPIDMTPEVKAVMAQKLRDAKDMVLRMEKSLPISFKTSVLDEKTTRELISSRVLLVQQYQGTEYNPLDNFTISPEELDASITKLRQYFNFVYRRMLEQKKNHSQDQARQPQQSQPQPQAVHQASQARMPPLNAENLQHQQQALQMARNASLQRHHSARDSRPPAAPTSSQPPFPIGAASPHSVPQIFRPNSLTQEQLNWPPAKKRKPNQAGSAASTPAQALGTPGSAASPQLTKLASPEMQRQGIIKVDAEAMATFRCPNDNCEYNIKNFTSQTELNRHITEAHEMREPHIEDPLSWTLESLAHGLGLDSSGKSKTKVSDSTKRTAGAQNMQPTTSKQGETPKPKHEAGTPVTRTTTPMVRPPMQTGSSPAPSLLKTPQTTSMKTHGPAASVTKSLPKRSSKGDSTATPMQTVRPSIQRSPTPPDMWADSSIRPADLLQCFRGIDTLPIIGSFAQMQASLTPASTRSGGSSARGDKKDSPRESDISENDELQISIAADEEPLWNPFGLYDGLTGDLEDMRFGEELVMMDWERLQETNEQDGSVKGHGGGGQKWAPSPAWNPNLFFWK